MQQATKSVISSQYTMDGEPVCTIDSVPWCDDEQQLRWNEHIDKISGAANRLLGFLWQSLNNC